MNFEFLSVVIVGVLFVFPSRKAQLLSTLQGNPIIALTTPSTGMIVRGVESLDPKSFPWTVFIELDNGQNQCGGTLIAHQWILTAAHCFDDGKEPTQIYLGTTNIRAVGGGVKTKVVYRCCHKEYNFETLDNDICLLKIDTTLPWFITPVILPLSENQVTATGIQCTILGWGFDENQNLPENLHQAKVSIIDKEKCIEWHTANRIVVVNNTICAGHESGGADTCGGDSGGPLVCNVRGRGFELRGVTSYGPSQCGKARAPGIYTEVTKFMKWIENTINNPCPQYHWGEWKTVCPVTCGRGIATRSRPCLDDQNRETDVSNCNGGWQTVVVCNLGKCPEYRWSPWKEGRCSVTCGAGSKIDERACIDERNSTAPVKNCDGPQNRTLDCIAPPCPVYHWGAWRRSCSVSCGEGLETSLRTCLDESNSTVPNELCSGEAAMVQLCKLVDCPVSAHAWTEWSSWSECQVGASGDPCFALKYSTRICTRNGRETEAELCSDPPDHLRQTSCSAEGCLVHSPIFNFEEWRQNLLTGGKRR